MAKIHTVCLGPSRRVQTYSSEWGSLLGSCQVVLISKGNPQRLLLNQRRQLKPKDRSLSLPEVTGFVDPFDGDVPTRLGIRVNLVVAPG